MAKITYNAIASACLAALDAEGQGYYSDTLDIIPAVNKAQLLLMDMLNKRIGQKKYNEEKLKGVILNRIYQTSNWGRVQVDTPPIQVFSIISVVLNPSVSYQTTATAVPYAPLSPAPTDGASGYNPNFVYFSGGQACARLNSQERYSNAGNPFMPGFVSQNPNPQNTSPAYLSFIDYMSEINTNVTYEIEIQPKQAGQQPIAVVFLKQPTVIVNTTDILDFDTVLMEWLTEATLAYLAVKGLEGTTLTQETQSFLSNLLDSIM